MRNDAERSRLSLKNFGIFISLKLRGGLLALLSRQVLGRSRGLYRFLLVLDRLGIVFLCILFRTCPSTFLALNESRADMNEAKYKSRKISKNALAAMFVKKQRHDGLNALTPSSCPTSTLGRQRATHTLHCSTRRSTRCMLPWVCPPTCPLNQTFVRAGRTKCCSVSSGCSLQKKKGPLLPIQKTKQEDSDLKIQHDGATIRRDCTTFGPSAAALVAAR